MLNDKSYVLTKNGLLFNVTGYHHPPQSVFASLKYIDGKKWKDGYSAAKTFLSQHHPDFVDNSGQYICVPHNRIAKSYDPQERWRELLATSTPSPLHQQAMELARQISDNLRIPLEEFAITDSLLWGDGHAASDIDLLVVGMGHAQKILENGARLYRHPDFARPDPKVMTAPYSLDVPDWPKLLDRKFHMGAFQGRLFSLRAIRDATPPGAHEPTPPPTSREITFTIADASQSLFFPAIYTNSAGDELVDYSVVYEGVFRSGDVVRCLISEERNRAKSRFVIDGPCNIVQHHAQSQ